MTIELSAAELDSLIVSLSAASEARRSSLQRRYQTCRVILLVHAWPCVALPMGCMWSGGGSQDIVPYVNNRTSYAFSAV